MRNLWRVFTGACAAAALLAQTTAGAAPAPADADAAFAQFFALAQAHKCPELLDLLAAPRVGVMLATLPADRQQAIDQAGYKCAREGMKIDLALKFAMAGTSLQNPLPEFWFFRLDAQASSGRYADLVTTFEQMTTANPEALANINLRWLANVKMLAAKASPDLQKRIAAIFGAPGFHTAEPGGSTDRYRHDFAIDEMAAGHTEAARAIFAQITVPVILMRATLEPQLRAFVPAGFDARAAVERHMATVRETVASHPDDLEAALALAYDYELLDKGAEMLAILLPVRPGKLHPVVAPNADYLRDWWATVSTAYRLQGDYDKALAIMQQSMAPGEVNEKVPSEWINIAAMQLKSGRAAAALDTLKTLDRDDKRLNARGHILWTMYHGCASWLTGDAAMAETDLAYVRQHDADAPFSTQNLELCMHRDDDAAAERIKNLADAQKATDVLLWFSVYEPGPASEAHDWYRMAIERLKQRPDIRAALAKAGGVGKFDIPPL